MIMSIEENKQLPSFAVLSSDVSEYSLEHINKVFRQLLDKDRPYENYSTYLNYMGYLCREQFKHLKQANNFELAASKLVEAAVYYTRSININKKDAIALLNRGEIRIHQGQNKEALVDLQAALESIGEKPQQLSDAQKIILTNDIAHVSKELRQGNAGKTFVERVAESRKQRSTPCERCVIL
jgi:tetratricopeptide (TPR) repeat protein